MGTETVLICCVSVVRFFQRFHAHDGGVRGCGDDGDHVLHESDDEKDILLPGDLHHEVGERELEKRTKKGGSTS